jgi:hypothetical protein
VFDVVRVYKGDVRAQQAVVTAREGASCGLEIAGNGPFLVFALSRGDGLLTANLCGGTRLLADSVVPSEFGPGLAPTPGSSPMGPAPTSGAAVFPPLLAGGAVAAVAAVLLALRRRRDEFGPTGASM